LTLLPELCIIKYLLVVKNYNRYYKYIDIDKAFNMVALLFSVVKRMHEAVPETDKTIDDLEVAVYADYPAMPKSERDTVIDMLNTLRKMEVSDAVAANAMEAIRKRAKARALAIAALDMAEGRADEATLKEAYDDVQGQVTAGTSVLSSRNWVTSDLYKLRDLTINAPGLKWPLYSLNASLGPLRKGDFGFVFARPESGKTTFIAHMVSHMATQLEPGQRIVWFNNEENGEKPRIRTFQAVFGVTDVTLFANMDRYHTEYNDRIGDKLLIYDEASIDARIVETILDELQPRLVIFDQIDKIHGFKADRPDLVFGRIYIWARELAKHYCPVIGTCQADGTGEGVKWLTMGHVAEAKTTKQAEADWILGIGKSNEGGTEDVRFFNISKNKLMGDADTDPELRHGRFDVYIRPQIARYEDVI
jgi:AAA domain-containing protein